MPEIDSTDFGCNIQMSEWLLPIQRSFHISGYIENENKHWWFNRALCLRNRWKSRISHCLFSDRFDSYYCCLNKPFRICLTKLFIRAYHRSINRKWSCYGWAWAWTNKGSITV